jgi:hypothetical protein
MPGSFVVVIGTFDNARRAQTAETQVRQQKLEPYAIDIAVGPEDIQRRLLLGRYQTAEEAEAVRAKLAPAFAGARVVPSAQERVRLLIP